MDRWNENRANWIEKLLVLSVAGMLLGLGMCGLALKGERNNPAYSGYPGSSGPSLIGAAIFLLSLFLCVFLAVIVIVKAIWSYSTNERFELYLQFDSLQPGPLRQLRGADLRRVRERALARLNELGISTTLVVTVEHGVNDGELGAIVDFALRQPCVRGVTFQPVQQADRLGGFVRSTGSRLPRYAAVSWSRPASFSRRTSSRSRAIRTRWLWRMRSSSTEK